MYPKNKIDKIDLGGVVDKSFKDGTSIYFDTSELPQISFSIHKDMDKIIRDINKRFFPKFYEVMEKFNKAKEEHAKDRGTFSETCNFLKRNGFDVNKRGETADVYPSSHDTYSEISFDSTLDFNSKVRIDRLYISAEEFVEIINLLKRKRSL